MKLTKALPYLLSIVIPIVLFIINRSEQFISYPFDMILYFQTFLCVLVIAHIGSLYSLEKNMDRSLKLFKAVVDSWMEMRKKLVLLPKGKRITGEDLVDSLVEPGKAMNGGLSEILFDMLRGSPSSYHRIRELMEKARKNEIDPEEAEELKNLLEEEKRRRERGGDIVGAILFGLLIIFILGVIAGLIGGAAAGD